MVQVMTMAAPMPVKMREKRGLDIIDPNTGKSIFDKVYITFFFFIKYI
jgi:hypothetical protein